MKKLFEKENDVWYVHPVVVLLTDIGTVAGTYWACVLWFG